MGWDSHSVDDFWEAAHVESAVGGVGVSGQFVVHWEVLGCSTIF